jgi:hypothetical protein
VIKLNFDQDIPNCMSDRDDPCIQPCYDVIKISALADVRALVRRSMREVMSTLGNLFRIGFMVKLSWGFGICYSDLAATLCCYGSDECGFDGLLQFYLYHAYGAEPYS